MAAPFSSLLRRGATFFFFAAGLAWRRPLAFFLALLRGLAWRSFRASSSAPSASSSSAFERSLFCSCLSIFLICFCFAAACPWRSCPRAACRRPAERWRRCFPSRRRRAGRPRRSPAPPRRATMPTPLAPLPRIDSRSLTSSRRRAFAARGRPRPRPAAAAALSAVWTCSVQARRPTSAGRGRLDRRTSRPGSPTRPGSRSSSRARLWRFPAGICEQLRYNFFASPGFAAWIRPCTRRNTFQPK